MEAVETKDNLTNFLRELEALGDKYEVYFYGNVQGTVGQQQFRDLRMVVGGLAVTEVTGSEFTNDLKVIRHI